MVGSRLGQAALRCYPERWRDRHGEEAAELARLLIRDGGTWGCIDGIVLPVHFTGPARIVVGRAARPGEAGAKPANSKAASRHDRHR